jgi:hypothetical protein
MASSCIYLFSKLSLVEERRRGSKELLRVVAVQHARKGSIDAIFAKDLDTIGTHVKMVTQLT